MKRKSLLLIAILLTVLYGLSTVSANENSSDVDMTLGDSNPISPIPVDNWNDLKTYCESPNDQIVYLNGSFTIDSQIQINNNVNIIGDANYYIGGSANNVNTYSNVAFLCNDALNVSFTNVNFQYTSGKYLMQFSGNGNYELENCNFLNMNSGNDKGIIYSNYGITNITNCNFDDCTVKTGVIYNYYAANSATVNNARLYVTDSRFRNNYASSHSGAIANSGYLLVENSTFENNDANSWAGAIHTAAYANTTIHNSKFENNTAGWNGGALYAYSNLQIYNSSFISNYCYTNNGGGAIGACKMNTEPNIYVIDSLFKNNINKCNHLDNLSTTGVGRGGAISIMDDGTLKVYNNTFISNDAVIGTAICALSQGSYGSPDVEIVGNNFTNHTSVWGSDLFVISLSNSNYLVENNTYSNNNISIGKFRLDIDDNNGVVTVNVTLKLKHPEYYDSDIITKSGFAVYVDDNYTNKIIFHDTVFTLNLTSGVNHKIEVVPVFSNISKHKNTNDPMYNTIYVSTTGSDLNNGISRNTAVRTISRAIDLAQSDIEFIKILEGTYYERNITIHYEKIIEGEGNVIFVGDNTGLNTFDVDASCEFNNLQFTGITSGIAINSEDNVININNCSFYSNNVGEKLINAKELNIRDSTINNNYANYIVYATKLNMDNCNLYDNSIKTISSTSYAIVYMAGGTIYNSTFTNNLGRYGILRTAGNNVTVTQSNFISNNAKNGKTASYGGAIYATTTNINIISSIFYNNYAYTTGGAIYLTNSVNTLNITDSVLIGNTATSKNYQIGRPTNPTSNIFAINNWWGNTIDNAYVAPTFQSNTNVNASIWLILNVTSNVTSLASGQSALVTFDLTYTNILGSDSNDTNITGNLTPFCIDGVYLPILEGVLTATNGIVNDTDILLIDGKANVLFTATSNVSYLTIEVLGISESIYFDNGRLLLLNELNPISTDSVVVEEISSKKYSQKDLLGYGLNPDEWYEEGMFTICGVIRIFNNSAMFIPYMEDEFYYNWMDDDDMEEFMNNGIPDDFYGGENNVHVNLSLFNETLDYWQIIVEDSFYVPFPSYLPYPSANVYNKIFNFTRGLYKFSIVYDGQDIKYEYIDEDTGDPVTEYYHYSERSWECELDFDGDFIKSIINIDSVVSYENSNIIINPTISYEFDLYDEEVPYIDEYVDEEEYEYRQFYLDEFKNCEYDPESDDWFGGVNLDVKDYNPEDFPQVKPVNIAMTITQGDKVVKEFSVAPGDTYSFNDLAAGEYTLTAVYDDPYYGYAEKTVTISVYKNIWENVGADEGYSHQTEYFGPKNVEELWNLSVDDNNFNFNDNYQSSVIDSDGNIYVVNGTKILVINSDGDLIKTLTITSEGRTGFFSKGLALCNNYLICSVYNSAMYGASVWDISDNYANSWFEWCGWGPEEDKKSTTSYYAPVVSNGKVYISSWQYYSDNDHIYEWTTNTHSNPFPRSTGAPSVDSAGYIYVNTKSGLYILDPELNIMDLSFGDAGKYGRPVIDSADIAYVFNADRTKVYAINREADNPILWTTDVAGGACGAMAVDVENNALYIVGNDGILYKLNRATGELSEFYTLGTTSSSILVDGRGTVYVGGDDGIMYAVTNEGKTLFKYDVGSPISKDLVLDNNGTLYVYANFTVYALTGAPRLYSEIIINVSDVSAKRNNTIVATLPENATGNVTFIIDDTIESGEIPIVSGNATWIAPGLLSGNHSVKASWIGDSEYFGSDATEEFNVYKVNSTIDLEDSVNYVGKLTQLNITLPEDAVGNVTVTFNRKSESVEIVNGTATFETTPLEAGNYTIDFSFDGDERYLANSSYAYFTVIKNDAGLTITANPIKEGEDLNVTVTVSDDESGIILINVGDVKDYATIKDGEVNFIISGLAADTYDITAEYIGDNKYNNATETSQVVVSAKDKADIEINPNVIVEDDKSGVEVTLPDDATGYILLEVNGNTFYANVTGGKVIVPVSGLDADTSYPVTVTYSGDDNYSAATKEGEIKTPEVKLLDSGLKLDITDTVISVSINESATGKVIVTVGDISFVGEAPDLEVIDVSEYLANGTYPVTVEYLGDAVFANATKTSTVTVPEEPVVEPIDPELKVSVDGTEVTISLNENATGYVLVSVGDDDLFYELDGEDIVMDLSDMQPGKYTVEVLYLGDEIFAADEASAKVEIPEIEPLDPELEVSVDGTEVTISLNDYASGVVLVGIGDEVLYYEFGGEDIVVDLSGFEPGNYSVEVTYLGDDVFAEANTTVDVEVPEEPVVEPLDPELKVTAENATVTISLNENATGYVLVDVSGDVFYYEFDGEDIVIDIFFPGNYTVDVNYLGDDTFAPANATVDVEVPEIEPLDPELSAVVDDTFVIISLNENATGFVLVDVGDNVLYYELDGEDIVVDLSDLAPGNYTVDIYYSGDDVFAEANTTAEVNVPEIPPVEPKDPNLKATAVNNTITATVDKDATGSIMVDVDGQGYYAPIKNGKAVINVIGLDAGKYDALVTYAGDDTFKAAKTTVGVTVPKKEDPQPEPVDPKADIKITNETVSVDLPEDATGYVLVDVDGTGYYTAVKDGKATFDLPELAPGNHTISVTYTGDKKYSSANATETVSVEENIPTVIAENLTKVQKAPDRFEALFTDAEGKALANAEVTFELNGNKYTRTTDANGKAGMNINLEPGNYTMVTTNPVTKESVTNTITVLPRLEGNDLTKYYRNASQYLVKVYDDNGNPVKAGEIVTFNINGVFYNRTTRDDGFVQLSINLEAGDYVCTAEYKGCRISNNIKVLPILSAKDLTKKYGQPGAFEATLVDGQGKPYANQQVEFNINGVFYKRTTDNNGVAKLNINLQAGEYIITSSYNGFNIANKVTVTA